MKHLVIHLGGRNSLLLPSGLSSQGTEGQSNWGALSTSATYSNSQKAQPAKERCSVLGTGPIIILVWGDEAGCTWRVMVLFSDLSFCSINACVHLWCSLTPQEDVYITSSLPHLLGRLLTSNMECKHRLLWKGKGI